MKSVTKSVHMPPKVPTAPPGYYAEYHPYMQPYQPPPPYSPQFAPIAQPAIKIIMPIVFGRKSIKLDCPNCRQTVNTKTEKHVGMLTYSMSVGLATMGCLLCLPCIGLLPLCIPQWKDVSHTCPKCNIHLGNFSRLRA